MNQIDREQLAILLDYIGKKEVLDDFWYVECEDCGHVFKVYSKLSMVKRQYCDQCRLVRNRPRARKPSNVDIGWKKFQHYNKRNKDEEL